MTHTQLYADLTTKWRHKSSVLTNLKDETIDQLFYLPDLEALDYPLDYMNHFLSDNFFEYDFDEAWRGAVFSFLYLCLHTSKFWMTIPECYRLSIQTKLSFEQMRDRNDRSRHTVDLSRYHLLERENTSVTKVQKTGIDHGSTSPVDKVTFLQGSSDIQVEVAGTSHTVHSEQTLIENETEAYLIPDSASVYEDPDTKFRNCGLSTSRSEEYEYLAASKVSNSHHSLVYDVLPHFRNNSDVTDSFYHPLDERGLISRQTNGYNNRLLAFLELVDDYILSRGCSQLVIGIIGQSKIPSSVLSLLLSSLKRRKHTFKCLISLVDSNKDDPPDVDLLFCNPFGKCTSESATIFYSSFSSTFVLENIYDDYFSDEKIFFDYQLKVVPVGRLQAPFFKDERGIIKTMRHRPFSFYPITLHKYRGFMTLEQSLSGPNGIHFSGNSTIDEQMKWLSYESMVLSVSCYRNYKISLASTQVSNFFASLAVSAYNDVLLYDSKKKSFWYDSLLRRRIKAPIYLFSEFAEPLSDPNSSLIEDVTFMVLYRKLEPDKSYSQPDLISMGFSRLDLKRFVAKNLLTCHSRYHHAEYQIVVPSVSPMITSSNPYESSKTVVISKDRLITNSFKADNIVYLQSDSSRSVGKSLALALGIKIHDNILSFSDSGKKGALFSDLSVDKLMDGKVSVSFEPTDARKRRERKRTSELSSFNFGGNSVLSGRGNKPNSGKSKNGSVRRQQGRIFRQKWVKKKKQLSERGIN